MKSPIIPVLFLSEYPHALSGLGLTVIQFRQPIMRLPLEPLYHQTIAWKIAGATGQSLYCGMNFRGTANEYTVIGYSDGVARFRNERV